jgi:hypothetical protein
MVSVVDRPIDELMLCVVREKVWYFCTYLTKKFNEDKPRSNFAQLTFFNRSLSDLEESFVNEYQYLICRA